MQNKKSTKNFNLLLRIGLLFSFIVQLISPITIYAETTEDENTGGKEVEEVEEAEEQEDESNKEETEGSEDEEKVDEEESEEDEEDSDAGEDEEEDSDTDENEEEVEEGEYEPALAAEKVDEEDGEELYNLTVLHMNDTHARVEEYPKLISAINEKRTEDSLILHAGDVFSGTLYFTQHKGQADVALMNLMHLDAMVFGNHEFDLGDKEGGNESLSKFVEAAEFPLLGTNIDFSKDPFMNSLVVEEKAVTDPEDGMSHDSIIVEKNGEKIGLIGLTTEDTKHIASPAQVEFKNYIDSAKKAVEDLEAEKVNKIIAVTHLGYDVAPEIGNDRLLAKHVQGIDIIVGGHSHTELEKPVFINEDKDGNKMDPTVIVQTGEYANNLGKLDVQFDENGKIVKYSGKLIPTEDYENKEDKEALKLLESFKADVDDLNNQEIGAEAMKDLENPRDEHGGPSVRSNETELGNLITDAMLAKAKEKESDTVIALQNGGGIRAPIAKGPITVGEVINVLPFGNDPVVATLTGEEIKDILEHAVRQKPDENGGFLHVSGMTYYFDEEKESGDRIVKMYLLEDGEEVEIDLEKEYKITTNGFTGQGGDGFETFADAYEDGRVKDIGEIDWEQLRDYMVEEAYLGGVVDPVIEGRINNLKGLTIEEFKIKRLEERIAELEKALNDGKTDNKELKAEIAELQLLLAALLEDVEAGDTKLEELEKKISELEARIAELEEDSKEPETPGKDKDDNDKDESGAGKGEGNNDKNGKDEDKDTDKSDKKDGKLPKTGTNEYIYSIIGISLVTGGAVLYIIRRRKSSKV